MSDKKKKTPQTAYSASREWESLQPQRDEVKAEINRNSVRPSKLAELRYGRKTIAREKLEYNKQDKGNLKFVTARVEMFSLLNPLFEAKTASFNFAKLTSFRL